MQLVSVQSLAQPMFWRHWASTDGAAQAYRPRRSANGWLNGARHVRQVAGSAAIAPMQVAVSGPPAHAVVSVSRFASEQTFCSCCLIGIDVPFGQVLYAAGHVVCWSLHIRGTTRPLQNDPLAVQSAQATPPCPHELLSNPSPSHVLFARQHPLQFAGPHFATHCRPWQSWFVAVQSVHAAPPVGPQALSCVPTTHVLPEQHPFGHVAGPHAGSWQEPDSQTRGGIWFEQFWQSAPPLPQAFCCVPTAQMSPTQQPVGHVAGLQMLPATQLPAWSQTWFGPHVLQACPLAPHANGVVEVTH